MKLPQYSRCDALMQAIVIPIYIGVLNWALIGQAYWQSWRTFSIATGIAVGFSFVGWLGNNAIANAMHRRYPMRGQYRQRLLRQLILYLCESLANTAALFSVSI